MTDPASLPADGAPRSTRPVRVGVAAFLGAAAAVLLGVAVYYAANATALGTVEGKVPDSWGAAFQTRNVWPILTWSVLGIAAAAAGIYSLIQCRDDLTDRLARLLAFVSFGVALFALFVPIYLIAAAYSAGNVSSAFSKPVFLWGVALTGIFAVAGALFLAPNARSTVQLRILAMSFGCAAGLVTFLLGAVLPLTVYRATIAKGLQAWRDDWAAVVWPSVAIVGSLVLMFAALQLGRGMERRNQNVRRLVYGYNAVLTGLLLLAVLSLLNVIAYAEPFTRFFGRPFDWTAGGTNALSPATRNTLGDLQEPVKVYTFLFQPNIISSLLSSDMRTLLDNCKSLTPKFTWEAVSGSPESFAALRAMMEKYSISDPNGILITVGKETEGSQPAFVFIKAGDLVRAPERAGAENEYRFIGEGALLGGLQSLLEGKMTVYLTQGHGEWTAEGPPPGMQRRAPRDAGQLSTLKQKLTRRRGVEVKSLALDATTKAVPDDASVVVIAHPEAEFTKKELGVLRDYLRRERQTKKVKDKSGKEVEEEKVSAGRIVFLLEPRFVKEGTSSKVVRTGLEPLLAEYNVKLGENRILSGMRNPAESVYLPAPKSNNAIAAAFAGRQFRLTTAQTVTPLAEQSPGKLVEKLLVTPPRFPAWAETNPDVDPSALIRKMEEDQALFDKVFGPVQRGETLCVAVAVSDQGAGSAPRDAAHAGLTKDTPRMVVFGSASWLDNESLAGGLGVSNMDLFTNTLSWLREKSATGDTSTIESKDRKVYSLGLSEEQRDRVTFLPLMILVLGIFGMGMGVWVVRRR